LGTLAIQQHPAALFGSASAQGSAAFPGCMRLALSLKAFFEVGAAFPGWLQLKVIKTTNSAKARNDLVDIVDFLPAIVTRLWA